MKLPPRTVEQLLSHMPAIAPRAENQWAANFAWSILRQPRRPGWRPSNKQLALMRKLVAELFAAEDDQVIEDDLHGA